MITLIVTLTEFLINWLKNYTSKCSINCLGGRAPHTATGAPPGPLPGFKRYCGRELRKSSSNGEVGKN